MAGIGRLEAAARYACALLICLFASPASSAAPGMASNARRKRSGRPGSHDHESSDKVQNFKLVSWAKILEALNIDR
ncbi:hypothetical protein KFK14_01140 [Sphingobium phenoxybenzoativorans]|uniref:Uncharacterized protein n=1 Tax=Sphingobium phenoxybenzoativorans TaxID=1592790 RepID=A0A975K7A8_9SPHN|nr:hypothetical protein [Sphingobium phenoxybenzoativorans]QUT06128.1 hypothetical protein KFK14_01140 [Sphingobium phenoxybenzoativorans]